MRRKHSLQFGYDDTVDFAGSLCAPLVGGGLMSTPKFRSTLGPVFFFSLMNPHRYDVSPSKADDTIRVFQTKSKKVISLENELAHERETNEALRAQVDALNQEIAHLKPNTAHSGVDFKTLLSPREYQVLHGLVEGMLYKEIAEHLKISFETTHTYIRRIYEKMGVQSRTQAVVKFLNARRIVKCLT